MHGAGGAATLWHVTSAPTAPIAPRYLAALMVSKWLKMREMEPG